MRCLVQRVTAASVSVSGKIISEIDSGLVALVCVMRDDNIDKASKLSRKLVNLRIFQDNNGKMNLSLRDVGGSALIVSQFTLAADINSGNRPGFSSAAPPDHGKLLFAELTNFVKSYGINVTEGAFGEYMEVSLVNDGPVTIYMDI